MATKNNNEKLEIFRQKAKLLEDNLEYFPDFPKEGILYSEMFKILRTPELFSILRDLLIEKTKEFDPLPDVIIGIDSKGFLFGPLIALEMKIPFVPIRKRGKLPGSVKSASYELEYGKDIMEMQEGSIKKGQNAVLVDDCLATGGTLECASELVKAFEGNLIGCLVVTEKYELDGYKKLPCPVKCLMKDIMEMQEGSIKKGQNAVFVDDCLATGGTLECASELVKAFEGNLIGCLVVTEKYELDGYKKLPCPVKCLMKVK